MLAPRMTTSWRWCLAAAAICLAPFASTLDGQGLAYDRTTFIHGLGSDSTLWRRPGRDVPAAIRDGHGIDLKTVVTPTVGGTLAVASQRDNLRSRYLTGGQHVLVGHSMGGLVSRSAYYQNPNNIEGIITLNTPHQGSWLANNGPEAERYFADMDRRLRDAWKYMNWTSFGLLEWLADYPDPLKGVKDVAMILKQPATQDLKVGSALTVSLNEASNLRDANAGLPRANVYGTVTPSYITLRVQKSFQGQEQFTQLAINRRNRNLGRLKWCSRSAYLAIVTVVAARACGRAVRSVEAVDGRWRGWVNGTYRVSGPFGPLTVPRQVPFDGIVSNERQRYPGLTDQTFNFPVSETDHFTITRRGPALARIAQAMRKIQMRQVTATPPPDEPPPGKPPTPPEEEPPCGGSIRC